VIIMPDKMDAVLKSNDETSQEEMPFLAGDDWRQGSGRTTSQPSFMKKILIDCRYALCFHLLFMTAYVAIFIAGMQVAIAPVPTSLHREIPYKFLET